MHNKEYQYRPLSGEEVKQAAKYVLNFLIDNEAQKAEDLVYKVRAPFLTDNNGTIEVNFPNNNHEAHIIYHHPELKYALQLISQQIERIGRIFIRASNIPLNFMPWRVDRGQNTISQLVIESSGLLAFRPPLEVLAGLRDFQSAGEQVATIMEKERISALLPHQRPDYTGCQVEGEPVPSEVDDALAELADAEEKEREKERVTEKPTIPIYVGRDRVRLSDGRILGCPKPIDKKRRRKKDNEDSPQERLF